MLHMTPTRARDMEYFLWVTVTRCRVRQLITPQRGKLNTKAQRVRVQCKPQWRLRFK